MAPNCVQMRTVWFCAKKTGTYTKKQLKESVPCSGESSQLLFPQPNLSSNRFHRSLDLFVVQAFEGGRILLNINFIQPHRLFTLGQFVVLVRETYGVNLREYRLRDMVGSLVRSNK